jgi:hypothetical protein
MQNEFLLFKKSVPIPLLDFAIYAKLKYCILEILLMVNLIFSHKLNVFVINLEFVILVSIITFGWNQ